MTGSRRFPPPWTVDEAVESFCIRDANGQAFAYELRFVNQSSAASFLGGHHAAITLPGMPMSIESVTYAELGDRLGVSPEAARSLARRLRLPRRPGNDGKVRITVDLAEIQYKPLPTRSPGGYRAETDALNARIEQLQAELARLEVQKRCLELSSAGHRADFERERERCDILMVEALTLAKHAMSAREKAARLEGELAARRVGGWRRWIVAQQTVGSGPSRAASAAEVALARGRNRHSPVLVGVPVRA